VSSYKDTFEPDAFAPRAFAVGVFRGNRGIVEIPGIEYRAADTRLHYRASDNRLHYKAADTRLHYRGDEQ